MGSRRSPWWKHYVLYKTPLYRRLACRNFHPLWNLNCYCDAVSAKTAAAMQADLDLMKANRDEAHKRVAYLIDQREDLRERGDALADALILFSPFDESDDTVRAALEAWNATQPSG